MQAPATQPLVAWFARLGPSGKILCIAALLGVIGTFLPWATFSMEMPAIKGFGKVAPITGISTSKSTMVLDDWRGKIQLLGFAGALVLGVMLYPAGGLTQKNLCWAAVGVGGVTCLLALWMLIAVLNAGGGADMAGFMGFKITPGIGAFVSLLAAAGVAVGAFLKTREEKLI